MSDNEDDYASFGKVLKPIEANDQIRKRPITVEEQIVTDENGRRRFHGAFTGGFSAGHFNTVNTPEGWYPKQFKSSRVSKNEYKTQRPEDFMDDEDMGEFGFAPSALKTAATFQSKQKETRPVSQPQSSSSIPKSAVLEQLIQGKHNTIGEKLLMSMGWKPGQGIGPKLNKQGKNDQKSNLHRTYGCSMPPAREEDDDEDDPIMEQYKDFLFAPDEVPHFVSKPKDDFFGIGYSGLERPTQYTGIGSNKDDPAALKWNERNGKLKISGQAFGVGAYEEEDEDIYDVNNMGQYDLSLDVQGDKRERKIDRASRWGKAKSVDELSGAVAGFSIGTSKSQIKKFFTPPDIPKEWVPKKDPSKKKSRFDQTPKEATKDRVVNTNPSVDERRSRLFPDEVSEKKAPETKIISGGFREKKKEEPKPDINLILSDLSTSADHFDQSGFKPFERDPEKQKRYDQYLRCLKNGRSDALGILQPKTMLAWEKERERVEFDRAAIMFRPSKGGMSTKFVSGGNVEDTDDSNKKGLTTDPESEAKASKRKAADMKMFGKLTREQVDWHPARVLCIRFNVKHPYSDYSVVGVASKKKDPTFSLFASIDQEPAKDNEAKDEVKGDDAKIDVERKEEHGETEKPSMDLFKAIFLDSDSDSDEDVEMDLVEKEAETRAEREIAPKVPPKPWEEKKENLLRNNEPAKGIFANIDFDALNKKRVTAIEEVPKETSEKEAPKKHTKVDEQSDKGRCEIIENENSRDKPHQRLILNSLGSKAHASKEDSPSLPEKMMFRRKEERSKKGEDNSSLRNKASDFFKNEASDSSDSSEYGPTLPPKPLGKDSGKSIVISSDSDSDDDQWKVKKKKKKHKKEKKKKHKKEKKKSLKD